MLFSRSTDKTFPSLLARLIFISLSIGSATTQHARRTQFMLSWGWMRRPFTDETSLKASNRWSKSKQFFHLEKENFSPPFKNDPHHYPRGKKRKVNKKKPQKSNHDFRNFSFFGEAHYVCETSYILRRAPDNRGVSYQHSKLEIFGGWLSLFSMCTKGKVHWPTIRKAGSIRNVERGVLCCVWPPTQIHVSLVCFGIRRCNNKAQIYRVTSNKIWTFFLLGCERRARERSSTDDKNLTKKKQNFSFFSFPTLSGFPFNKAEHSPICASLFRQAPHMKLWGDKEEKKSLRLFISQPFQNVTLWVHFFFCLKAVEHAECDSRLFLYKCGVYALWVLM